MAELRRCQIAFGRGRTSMAGLRWPDFDGRTSMVCRWRAPLRQGEGNWPELAATG